MNKFYPVGQRIRIIGSDHLKYLIGCTGTVIGPPATASRMDKTWWGGRSRRTWVGQPVAVDDIGHNVPDPDEPHGTVKYWPNPEFLEPLDDGNEKASWDAVKKATKWTPRENVKL